MVVDEEAVTGVVVMAGVDRHGRVQDGGEEQVVLRCLCGGEAPQPLHLQPVHSLAPEFERRPEVGDGVEGGAVDEGDVGAMGYGGDLVSDALRDDRLSGSHGMAVHLRQADLGGPLGEAAGAGHDQPVAAQFPLDPLQQGRLAGGVGAEHPDTDRRHLGHHRVGSFSGSGAPGRPGGTAAATSSSQVT